MTTTYQILCKNSFMLIKRHFAFLLYAFIAYGLNAQTYIATTIIEKRAYYLNGGARASLGGKSRVSIKIDLPKNTRKWYYSFSTTPGENGIQLLNLGIQITSALTSGGFT